MQLDYYLHASVMELFSEIRNRSLVQYFAPYSQVDLKVMANTFRTPVAVLEKEIVS